MTRRRPFTREGLSACRPTHQVGSAVSIEQVEEGDELAPRFDADGLILVVTSDHGSGEVLMPGYMNAEALARTIETGEAHYWSRSRRCRGARGRPAASSSE